MKKIALAILIIFTGLLTISTILGNEQSAAPIQAVEVPKSVQVPTYEKPTAQRLLELTNAERAKAGVKPLVMDERLNQSAQKKADELVTTGKFSHINANGLNTAHYAEQSMNGCLYYSENLAMDYTANPIVGFKSSKAHWDAILDTRYEYIGFGITDKYIAVHFCDLN